MRGALTRLLALTLAVTGLLLFRASTSAEAADCEGPVTDRGVCLGGTTPGTPGGENGGTSLTSGGGGGCQDTSGNLIPCVDGFGGVWVAARQCYGFQLDPQPPPDSPLWKGNRPSEGSIWSCDRTVAIPENTWFVPGASPVIDAATVAEDLVRRAPFETAHASIAPPPSFHSYVNYKNWMWIPEKQWHDVSVSVDAGGARVTLSATPTRVEWDMGNGDVEFCAGAGRVWTVSTPEDAPTTCDYTYTDMEDPTGDTWEVSARIVYSVAWSCTGRCSSPDGSLGEHAAVAGESTTIRVLQRQTVVIR
jgi:hypothetical protein